MAFKITIDKEKCIGCGACAAVCGNFELVKGKAQVKKDILLFILNFVVFELGIFIHLNILYSFQLNKIGVYPSGHINIFHILLESSAFASQILWSFEIPKIECYYYYN